MILKQNYELLLLPLITENFSSWVPYCTVQNTVKNQMLRLRFHPFFFFAFFQPYYSKTSFSISFFSFLFFSTKDKNIWRQFVVYLIKEIFISPSSFIHLLFDQRLIWLYFTVLLPAEYKLHNSRWWWHIFGDVS